MAQRIISRCLFFWFIFRVSSWSYFIHESCAEEDHFRPALLEAIHMAQYANARLHDLVGRLRNDGPILPDQNDRRNYKLLFRTDIDDLPVREKVLGITEGIGALTEETDRKKSNIRFYCDSDLGNRFKVVPDIPTTNLVLGSPEVANSLRTDTQEVDDEENGIRLFGKVRRCQQPAKSVRAYTSDPGNAMTRGKYGDQAYPRSVITFCKGAFGVDVGTIPKDEGKNMHGVPVATYARFSSLLILHEVLHAPPANTIDHLIQAGEPDILAYGWENLLGLTRRDAFYNDDSFGYWILLTYIATEGYRVTRRDVTSSHMISGVLTFDHTVIRGPIPVLPPGNIVVMFSNHNEPGQWPPLLTISRPAPRPPPTIPAPPQINNFKQWDKVKRQFELPLSRREQSSFDKRGVERGAKPRVFLPVSHERWSPKPRKVQMFEELHQ